MDKIPFKLYPNGFLGKMLEGRLEKQAQAKESVFGFRNIKALVMQNQNDVDHTNPEVETLYAKYISNAPDVNSFEFRKQVLVVALSAFGTQMFNFWYEMQRQSPGFGDLHSKFLDDTLTFIRTGKREMSLETWGSLLDSTGTKPPQSKISDVALEFFGSNDYGRGRVLRPTPFIEILQMWCCKTNGLEDLLHTLHILFGKD